MDLVFGVWTNGNKIFKIVFRKDFCRLQQARRRLKIWLPSEKTLVVSRGGNFVDVKTKMYEVSIQPEKTAQDEHDKSVKRQLLLRNRFPRCVIDTATWRAGLRE